MASRDKNNSAGVREPEDLDEETFAVSKSDKSDAKFDATIGHIEDIIIEDEFQDMQTQFFDKYYKEFDEADENRLIYTDIHNKYTKLIEKYLEQELKQRITDFSMTEFQKQLTNRRDELDGEVFEILLTFSDFSAFKETILAYKADMEGRYVDLSANIVITSLDAVTPRGTGKTPRGAGETLGGKQNGLQPHAGNLMDCTPCTAADDDDDDEWVDENDDDDDDGAARGGSAVRGGSGRREGSGRSGGSVGRGDDLGLCLYGMSIKPPNSRR